MCTRPAQIRTTNKWNDASQKLKIWTVPDFETVDGTVVEVALEAT
jgi:hypothetical protein